MSVTIETMLPGGFLKIAGVGNATTTQFTVITEATSGVIEIKHRYHQPGADKANNVNSMSDCTDASFDYNPANYISLAPAGGILNRTSIFEGRYGGFWIRNNTAATIKIEMVVY